ncbi:DUF4270 domain-containing protein [Xylanibacter muris]|nr:DUF4270 domain-containing protein [Xylanibacter muris]
MKNIFSTAVIAIISMAIISCDDNTDSLGSSLTNDVDNYNISVDTFNVNTRSILVDSVLSTNIYSYLGYIQDPETNTYVRSNYSTQFNVQPSLSGLDFFPEQDSIRSLDENGQVMADSCYLYMYINSSIGDSLNPMKLTVYEMGTPVEEGKTYYSNFNPEEKGYLRNDNNAMNINKMFTLLDLNLSDSLRALIKNKTNMMHITIPLNQPYTAKDGSQYNNYGTYILREYYKNKENFNNSYNFAKNICPGFYFKITDGIGSMAEVYLTELHLSYRFTSEDSVYNGLQIFSGTEEVMQTSYIENDKANIKKLVDDNTCTYLKTPAGIFTEVTIPVEEIKLNHENDTLSSAKITFNCLNSKSMNKEELNIQNNIVMIPKDSLYSFFEQQTLPNNTTSYMATYNATYNNYTFNNISALISDMYNKKQKGNVSENWNKVVLVPVAPTYTKSSSYGNQTLTRISNEMLMKSTRLVGGSANSRKPVTISVIYNKSSK